MTNTAHNLIVLREAQRTIENFERTYGLTTQEMLRAAEHDERLSQIDGFELMDWQFAVDQKDAIASRIASASREPEQCARYFFSSQYHLVSTGVLENAAEPELELVA